MIMGDASSRRPISAGAEQQRGHLDVAPDAGDMERRLADAVAAAGIDARREQPRHGRHVVVLGGRQRLVEGGHFREGAAALAVSLQGACGVLGVKAADCSPNAKTRTTAWPHVAGNKP